MSRELLKADLAALPQEAPAAALEGALARRFLDLRAFRENDDLVVLAGETRRLLIRRTGPDRFLLAESAAASGSTNLLDEGAGLERDLDGLVDEVAGLADL